MMRPMTDRLEAACRGRLELTSAQDEIRNAFAEYLNQPDPSSDGGIPLRDYFAGQALIGLLAGSAGDKVSDVDAQAFLDGLSGAAYSIADDMLKERRQP